MGNKFLERSFGKYPQFFRSFYRQSIFETCSGVRKWHFQVEKPAEVQEKKFFQRASQVKVRGQKLHKILWVPAKIAKWFRPENHETFWWRLLLMWGGHKWLCQGWPTFPATIAGLATNKVSFCILFIKNHLSAFVLHREVIVLFCLLLQMSHDSFRPLKGSLRWHSALQGPWPCLYIASAT